LQGGDKVAAGNHNLGTIRGTIEIDYNGAGIVRAIKDTDKAKKEGDGLEKTADKILGAFGKFAAGGAKFAGGVNLITNAVHLVSGAIATIGPIAAAGFAVLPGIALSGAAAMTIFKVATSGVGDALKNAGGDAKKFDKDIKNLAPNAQAFARSFKQALPVLTQVRNSIQQAFFAKTSGQVANVVAAVQRLRGAATQVAASMNRVVVETVAFVTTGKSVNGIQSILGGVKAFLDRIHGAIGPLIQAFIGLAAQASVFGGALGGKVNAGLTKFVSFINSINVGALFQKALPILQAFGTTFKNIGSIAQSIFSIFTTNGGGAATILATLTGTLAAFLKSAQGQGALTAIGTALQAISTGAGQIFLALLQALAPALVALAPGVTVLAGQITGLLVPSINALAPLLQALAGFLSDNMSWLGPLAGAVVAVAAAYKVYQTGADAVSKIQDVLTSKIVRNTAAWVANAAVATAKWVAGVVTSIASASAAWVANTAAMIANRAAGVAVAAIMVGQVIAAWVANTAAVVANRIAITAVAIAQNIVKIATMAWAGAQWLLNAALDANPIGLIVIAIAALVAGLIYAYNHSAAFRAIVQATWAAIKVAIATVINWITGTVWPAIVAAWHGIASGAVSLWHSIVNAFNAIRSGVAAAINAVRSVVLAIWNAIVAGVRAYINAYRAVITAGFNAARAVVSSVVNAIRSVVSAVWSGIVSIIRNDINVIKNVINGIRSVINTIRNAFNSARNAAASALSSLVGVVRGLPGKVVSALGSLGGLLYSKGKSLVQGFINGIGSMIGAVKSKASSIVHAVTDFLPGSPAKTGPLSGKGYVLLRARRFMDDFAKGLNDGAQKPAAAISGTVNPIARTVIPAVSRTPRATPAGEAVPDNPGTTRSYLVQIGDKAFAELVVDAITGEPVAVSKAADEGSRKSAWSGSGR
jgi:hypothetical protein